MDLEKMARLAELIVNATGREQLKLFVFGPQRYPHMYPQVAKIYVQIQGRDDRGVDTRKSLTIPS